MSVCVCVNALCWKRKKKKERRGPYLLSDQDILVQLRLGVEKLRSIVATQPNTEGDDKDGEHHPHTNRRVKQQVQHRVFSLSFSVFVWPPLQFVVLWAVV